MFNVFKDWVIFSGSEVLVVFFLVTGPDYFLDEDVVFAGYLEG